MATRPPGNAAAGWLCADLSGGLAGLPTRAIANRANAVPAATIATSHPRAAPRELANCSESFPHVRLLKRAGRALANNALRPFRSSVFDTLNKRAVILFHLANFL